ncbi:hypothetical protein RHMOL_Rhmol10G0235800 [Rhododendron molle]|uniref:Uncharacterized protein n=2 Tax=Rhododendron molle TaxID=49168 RepID=A0ACC0M5Q1_RHOML|nr:hypothetical protein RHMOL_Rhmol10G0235800 [Rhododendron molle]KAI8536176.1 hypothetical protein RHMOL_Rhmol10G0235800 [Rhododendron molle]
MAHDRRMSSLTLGEGLGQRSPLAALDVNKRHLWQLSPIEEDRVVKKQKKEDRVVKKQEEEDRVVKKQEEEDRVVKKQEEEDENDVNEEQRESPWMKLPPFQFATWRRLTEKEWEDYNECLEKSEGFDVGDVPDGILDIPVTPLSLDDPETMKDLQMYSIFALEEHNKPEKKKYQFVKVLKANISLRRGFLYYITFQAERITGFGFPPLNFRAKVHTLQGRMTVNFCEPEL